MTTEEKIFIAASFDSEKIKMIRELMEDTWRAAQEDAGKMSVSIKKAKGTSPIYCATKFSTEKIKQTK
jgi:hypothetical protein